MRCRSSWVGGALWGGGLQELAGPVVGGGVTLLRRLFIPTQRLRVIRRHALAGVVKECQGQGGLRVALLGGASQPLGRFRGVLGHACAVEETLRDVPLRFHRAGAGRLMEQIQKGPLGDRFRPSSFQGLRLAIEFLRRNSRRWWSRWGCR